MRRWLLFCTVLMLAGCGICRGHITVINHHQQRIHRLQIDGPDFKRVIFGLEPDGFFTINETISFRRPWHFTAELDDGSIIKGDSGDHGSVSPRLEVEVLADGSFRCITKIEPPRGP